MRLILSTLYFMFPTYVENLREDVRYILKKIKY